jgi:membrane protein required for colicin V production
MVASLLALVLGIIGAIEFRPLVATLLDSWFNIAPEHLNVIAFAVAFLLIVLVVHTVAFVVDKLIRAVALNFVNRVLGVVFGVVVTAFVLSMLLWPLNTVNEQRAVIKQERIEGSLLWNPISAFAPTVFPYLKREEFNGWMPGKKNSKRNERNGTEMKKEEPLEVV